MVMGGRAGCWVLGFWYASGGVFTLLFGFWVCYRQTECPPCRSPWGGVVLCGVGSPGAARYGAGLRGMLLRQANPTTSESQAQRLLSNHSPQQGTRFTEPTHGRTVFTPPPRVKENKPHQADPQGGAPRQKPANPHETRDQTTSRCPPAETKTQARTPATGRGEAGGRAPPVPQLPHHNTKPPGSTPQPDAPPRAHSTSSQATHSWSPPTSTKANRPRRHGVSNSTRPVAP